MNSLKSVNVLGTVLLLLIALLTIVAAQEKPDTAAEKQKTTLDAIAFDQVVLFTVQALENNYQVRVRLIPNVHPNDYYTVILMTAKRLALAKTSKKQINPVVKVPPKKQEKKPEKK